MAKIRNIFLNTFFVFLLTSFSSILLLTSITFDKRPHPFNFHNEIQQKSDQNNFLLLAEITENDTLFDSIRENNNNVIFNNYVKACINNSYIKDNNFRYISGLLISDHFHYFVLDLPPPILA